MYVTMIIGTEGAEFVQIDVGDDQDYNPMIMTDLVTHAREGLLQAMAAAGAQAEIEANLPD